MRIALALVIVTSLALLPAVSQAACANGANVAGCAGPSGAAVYNKNTGHVTTTGRTYRPAAPVYRSGGSVNCAAGSRAAGCVGPNGAAAVRRPY